MIVQKAGKLEVLDVSFVRAVDDTVVKSFLGGIQGLEVLFVSTFFSLTGVWRGLM